jgi:8-oxo-dGTP pyrophosphatase MutT (NUDIX family)
VSDLPGWLRPIAEGARAITADELTRFVPPPDTDARRGAVLMLFGEGPAGPDLLLTERAHGMRSHPGQISFPGGSLDPTDASPAAAALREAEEETGLDPAGVAPLALLPELFIPPSGFAVTPVLAHWERPKAVHAVDPGETAAVVRVPLAQLADPANRLSVRHSSGITAPGFTVAGLLVWGFTGGLLSALLDLGGWARPWDPTQVHDLEEAWSAARAGRQEVAGS